VATFYTFDLDNGAQLTAGETSTINLPGGGTKTPDQVVVGDTICHVACWTSVVTAISTSEV
jgi:hypothetical protein